MGRQMKAIDNIVGVFISISSIGFTLGALAIYPEQVNQKIFAMKTLETERDIAWLVLTLGLWTSIYLFTFSTSVIIIRIFNGYKLCSQNDLIYINAYLRINGSTKMQAIIFGGLFINTLCSWYQKTLTSMSSAQVLALASLFVIGRATYAMGSIAAAATGLKSFKIFGFLMNLQINAIMLGQCFGYDPIKFFAERFVPVFQKYVFSVNGNSNI